MPDQETGLAAVYTAAGKEMEIRRYPVKEPKGGDVLLRLELSGICGTDVHICEGRLPLAGPMILGHEFIGRVQALGPRARADGLGNALAQGDAAVACVAVPCGKCVSCRRGDTASCLRFGVTYFRNPDEPPHFFGGYAEYLFSPCRNLVKVPRGLSLEAVAAFACAGPTCIRAFETAGGLAKKELVVVQGTGPVGLFAIAWAAKAGCSVVAVGSGSNRKRLALARRLGASMVLDYRKTAAEERAKAVRKLAERLGRGDGADVVFEASGSPRAIPEGLDLVRTLGRYIVPGQYSSSGGVEIQPQLITFKAIRIIGSGQYKLQDIGAYLDFLTRRRDVQRAFAACVTHRYRVRDANKALANASKGKSVKGVFTP